MEDATNYLNNLGKPLEKRTFLLSVTYEELKIIRALAQNPHDWYLTNASLMRASQDIFNETKDILEKTERHTLATDDDLKF